MRARAADSLLARLRAAPHDGTLVVDLRDLRWVPPSIMVATAAQAHRARLEGTRFAVLGPLRSEPAGYVARMRLGTVLADLGAEHDLPRAPRRERDEHLIELAEIDTEGAADRLAALVYRKLRPTGAGLARALHQSVGEIGENVTDHAGTIGFMAAQTLPRRRELLLAVGDAGVGMLSTLAHRGAGSHEQAIELAIRERVSRYDEPDRGGGLPTALRLIGQQLGNVYIATGTASIRHFPTTRRYLQSSYPFPGTIVEARIPLAPHERPSTIGANEPPTR